MRKYIKQSDTTQYPHTNTTDLEKSSIFALDKTV